MSDFNDPGTGGDRVSWEALKGALLLFDVKGVEDKVATSFGDKPAIRADLAVLDGESKGDTFADSLVFGQVLIGQLRGSIGSKVLGRLGQGVAKPGQKPPWTLETATDGDKDTARKYLVYVEQQKAAVAEPF